MAGQPLVVLDRDAAEHEPPSRFQHMDVEAGADAGKKRGSHGALQPAQVFRVGQFYIVLGAGDDRHREARGFQERGIVGGREGRAGPMSGKQNREAEGLRRLRAEQAVARGGDSDQPAGHSLQRVGDRNGGDRSGCMFQGGQQCGDGALGYQWSCGVVHQHDIRSLRGQCLEAGADAFLARRTAGHGRKLLQMFECGLDRVRVPDWLQNVGVFRQSLGGVANHRLAGQRQELLWRLGAEPAAGAGGDQYGCDSHAGTVAALGGRVNMDAGKKVRFLTEFSEEGAPRATEGTAVPARIVPRFFLGDPRGFFLGELRVEPSLPTVSALHIGMRVANLPK